MLVATALPGLDAMIASTCGKPRCPCMLATLMPHLSSLWNSLFRGVQHAGVCWHHTLHCLCLNRYHTHRDSTQPSPASDHCAGPTCLCLSEAVAVKQPRLPACLTTVAACKTYTGSYQAQHNNRMQGDSKWHTSVYPRPVVYPETCREPTTERKWYSAASAVTAITE